MHMPLSFAKVLVARNACIPHYRHLSDLPNMLHSIATMSKGDHTIIAATELMNAWRKIVPDTCKAMRDHAKVLNKLTKMLSNG